MLVDVVIPALGESITEGTITGWHVSAGEQVEEDQPLLEVDTDKVSVDVPSPAAGVLQEILVESGDVAVGAVVARIEAGAKAGAAAKKPKAEEKPKPAGEKPQAEAKPKAEEKPQPEEKPQAPAEKKPGADAKEKPKAEERPEAGEEALSPAVRRMLAEHDLQAGQIRGTGPRGRILKEDVQAWLDAQAAQGEAPAPRKAPAPKPAAPEAPTPSPPGGRGERRVRMTRLRRRIAERLKEVQNTAAILTTFNEVDMSAVMAARKTYGEAFQKRHGLKLGMMSFFVKAVIEGLKQYPALNGYIDGDDIVYHDYFDIGVAVSTERGLVVPVLRDADRLGFAEIEKRIGELAKAARDGTLSLEDLSGGTFSITNGGVFGSLLSTPILNPPQSGILGMHTITQRPVAVGDRVEVRPVMFLAVSYDHRIVDGSEAVRFLVTVKRVIEDPTRLLLEV